MLTTRCPDCQTTFRITSVVLHRATGQVRCGHCKSIFDAFDSLTDTRRPAAGHSSEAAPAAPQNTGAEPMRETDTAAEQPRVTDTVAEQPQAGAAEHGAATAPNAAPTPYAYGATHVQLAEEAHAEGTTHALSAQALSTDSTTHEPSAEAPDTNVTAHLLSAAVPDANGTTPAAPSAEVADADATAHSRPAEPVTDAGAAQPEESTQLPAQASHAETIDPPEHAAADPDAPDAEQQALPALRESHPGEPTSSAPLPADPQPIAATRWRPLERGEPESPGWRLAAALAAGALLLQGAHHFRASLAHVPYLGTAVERLYSLTGQPIENFGDPQDFSIVEWAATAQESDAAQPGILEITAGVRNESDAPRRYPMLSLELTDRWQTVIGARVFVPEEYLDTGVSQNALIRPNSTVTAHLSLIDPGPEAYGFEVDVCVAADAGRIRCKSDLLFE